MGQHLVAISSGGARWRGGGTVADAVQVDQRLRCQRWDRCVSISSSSISVLNYVNENDGTDCAPAKLLKDL